MRAAPCNIRGIRGSLSLVFLFLSLSILYLAHSRSHPPHLPLFSHKRAAAYRFTHYRIQRVSVSSEPRAKQPLSFFLSISPCVCTVARFSWTPSEFSLASGEEDKRMNGYSRVEILRIARFRPGGICVTCGFSLSLPENKRLYSTILLSQLENDGGRREIV